MQKEIYWSQNRISYHFRETPLVVRRLKMEKKPQKVAYLEKQLELAHLLRAFFPDIMGKLPKKKLEKSMRITLTNAIMIKLS